MIGIQIMNGEIKTQQVTQQRGESNQRNINNYDYPTRQYPDLPDEGLQLHCGVLVLLFLTSFLTPRATPPANNISMPVMGTGGGQGGFGQG